MNVTVVLITPDEYVKTVVGLKKQAVVPSDLLKKGFYHDVGGSVTLNVYCSVPSTPELGIYIRKIAASSDCVVLLYDPIFAADVEALSTSIFKRPYAAQEMRRNTINYARKMVSQSLRMFSVYLRKFYSQKNRTLLLLPIQNFRAEEMGNLVDLFSGDVEIAGFVGGLEEVLKSLGGRRTPKKYNRYKAMYVVDDNGHHYDYGHERHAAVETKSPPHFLSCELTSILRFGARYDERRHYNVSLGEKSAKISGSFANCHGVNCAAEPHSHINMFPNGFWA